MAVGGYKEGLYHDRKNCYNLAIIFKLEDFHISAASSEPGTTKKELAERVRGSEV